MKVILTKSAFEDTAQPLNDFFIEVNDLLPVKKISRTIKGVEGGNFRIIFVLATILCRMLKINIHYYGLFVIWERKTGGTYGNNLAFSKNYEDLINFGIAYIFNSP